MRGLSLRHRRAARPARSARDRPGCSRLGGVRAGVEHHRRRCGRSAAIRQASRSDRRRSARRRCRPIPRGTRSRGTRCRGAAMRLSTRPMYAEARHESKHVDAIGPRRVPLDHVRRRARRPFRDGVEIGPVVAAVAHRNLDDGRCDRRPRPGERLRLFLDRRARARARSVSSGSKCIPTLQYAGTMSRTTRPSRACSRSASANDASLTSGSIALLELDEQHRVARPARIFIAAPRAACRECRRSRRST